MPTALLSVPQFAARLTISPNTVRDWVKLRKIETIKLGRVLRIPESEVERLLTQGRRPVVKLWDGKPARTLART